MTTNTPKPTAIQAIRDEIEMGLPAVQSEYGAPFRSSHQLLTHAILELAERLSKLETDNALAMLPILETATTNPEGINPGYSIKQRDIQVAQALSKPKKKPSKKPKRQRKPAK